MDRREALKTTSWLLGLSVSASAVAAVMQGCTADQTQSVGAGTPWEPLFLEPDDVQLVGELSETILPRTTTP
ncbi:MAG: hypothetical protein R3330_14385, partial [Saprospiraceae bacterium]|nr:hypothetical protein [Saprospiraceae bacterium]